MTDANQVNLSKSAKCILLDKYMDQYKLQVSSFQGVKPYMLLVQL